MLEAARCTNIGFGELLLALFAFGLFRGKRQSPVPGRSDVWILDVDGRHAEAGRWDLVQWTLRTIGD